MMKQAEAIKTGQTVTGLTLFGHRVTGVVTEIGERQLMVQTETGERSIERDSLQAAEARAANDARVSREDAEREDRDARIETARNRPEPATRPPGFAPAAAPTATETADEADNRRRHQVS